MLEKRAHFILALLIIFMPILAGGFYTKLLLSKQSGGYQTFTKRTIQKNQETSGFVSINQKQISWNGNVFSFVHLCKGQIKAGLDGVDGSTAYCIGENQLAYIDPYFSRTTVLKTETVTSDREAPVLLGAELVPSDSKTNATVLISYSQEPCTTTGSCGAGGPTNYVTHAYALADTDFALRRLTNYPSSGWPTWNPSGTKAVFVPDTCGGAGCDVAPLTGYDLATDSIKILTNEEAAGTAVGGVSDVEGAPLPKWSLTVRWINNSSFEAYVTEVDKSDTKISGTF